MKFRVFLSYVFKDGYIERLEMKEHILLLQDRIPLKELESIVEYIDYNEALLAWDFCADYLYENKIPITKDWLDKFYYYRTDLFKKPIDRGQFLHELII